MKNLMYRKRLLSLFLLFAMLGNCTGCALQAAKVQKMDIPQTIEKSENPEMGSAQSSEKQPEPEVSKEPEVKQQSETSKEPEKKPEVRPEPQEPPSIPEDHQESVETPPAVEEIPDQIDMEQLGNWYMSNEEYDEMVSNSNVGVGENQ